MAAHDVHSRDRSVNRPAGELGSPMTGVTQLAVKVYETGPRGLGNLTPDAAWESLTAQATSGLYRSVLGVIAPALANGGIVIA